MNNQTFISIDFSKNSTAMCIYKDSIYTFYNFIYQLNLNSKSKKLEIYKNKFNNFIYIERPLLETTNNYIDEQQLKMLDANLLSSQIMNEIINKTKLDITDISIEGFSYGSSNNNAFIDLVLYQSFLRKSLLDYKINPKIISPKTIKKFIGNGNMKKGIVIENLKYNILNDNELQSTDIYNWISKLNDKDINNKPIDDIADSYFQLRYLQTLNCNK